MTEDYLKQAKRAQRERDYQRAADFYYMANDYKNALKMYLKAENHELAAKVCVEVDDIPEAIALLRDSKNYLKAAELCQQIGEHSRAVEFYDAAGNLYKAAALAEQIGDYHKAGDIYSRYGDYIKAIKCYTTSYNPGKAFHLVKQLIMQRRKILKNENISEEIDNIIIGYKNKAAELLQKMKRYEEAGDMLMETDNKRKAAYMYSLGGNNEKAFKIYMELDLYYRALEEYEKSKDKIKIDTKTLAMVYSQTGNRRQAAELYEKEQMLREAAKEYEEDQNINKAAELYNMSNDPRYAAELLLNIGKVKEAVEVLAGSGRLKDAAKKAEEHGLLGLAGEYYEKLRNYEKAAQTYELGKKYEDAVRLYIKLNERKKALAIFQKRPESVADEKLKIEMFAETGNYSEAAELSLKTDDKKKAADYFTKAGMHEKAAGLYVEVEKYADAADSYVKANQLERAAWNYERAGRFEQAGDSYINLRKFSKAGGCYEAAKKYLKAAKVYINTKNLDRTINVLQKIKKGDPSYKDAAFMLGKIFHAKNFHNLAQLKLKEAINDQELNDDNIESYYYLARSLAFLGKYDEAVQHYDDILSKNFNYRDVLKLREEALKDKSEKKDVRGHFEETQNIGDLLQLQEGEMIARRFKVLGELGSGGMGKVFKAYDSELDETIAVKILLTQFGEYEEEKQKLVNEIKITRRITHPYVIKVYDIGDWLGNKFFTMQYIDGSDLKKWFQNNNNLDYKAKMVLFKKICEGTKAAHDMGIIHRDIKPKNILINKNNNPVILDFGIAEALNAYLKTTENLLIGSPDYMSPEQISRSNCDQRTDIYSLGCVMYEMFTGRKPYISKDITELFMAKLDRTPRPPSQINRDIPEELDRIIVKTIQRNPNSRYQNMNEIISDINLFLAT